MWRKRSRNEYLCHFVVEEGVDYRHHQSLNPRSWGQPLSLCVSRVMLDEKLTATLELKGLMSWLQALITRPAAFRLLHEGVPLR
jgi:hypothetical protein